MLDKPAMIPKILPTNKDSSIPIRKDNTVIKKDDQNTEFPNSLKRTVATTIGLGNRTSGYLVANINQARTSMVMLPIGRSRLFTVIEVFIR